MSQPFPGTATPTNTSLYLSPIVTSAVSPLRLLLLHFLVSMACWELKKYLLEKTVKYLNDMRGSFFLCLWHRAIIQFVGSACPAPNQMFQNPACTNDQVLNKTCSTRSACCMRSVFCMAFPHPELGCLSFKCMDCAHCGIWSGVKGIVCVWWGGKSQSRQYCRGVAWHSG